MLTVAGMYVNTHAAAEEVCAALDLSPGNQRLLLHRARSRVPAALERHFDG